MWLTQIIELFRDTMPMGIYQMWACDPLTGITVDQMTGRFLLLFQEEKVVRYVEGTGYNDLM